MQLNDPSSVYPTEPPYSRRVDFSEFSDTGAKLMADRELVIVLDDDVSMLGALQRLLGGHGFDVHGFDTAEALLEHAPLRDARCLILDINLNGRSGIDLRRQLTQLGYSLPVIFITGSERQGTRQAALEAGCVALLTKPFSAADLIPAVEAAIHGVSARSA
jgi:FixJ family two-component response regulator